jgi:hypothetical protein
LFYECRHGAYLVLLLLLLLQRRLMSAVKRLYVVNTDAQTDVAVYATGDRNGGCKTRWNLTTIDAQIYISLATQTGA